MNPMLPAEDRCGLKMFVQAALAVVILSAALAHTPDLAADNLDYRAVEWQALVPEGWKAPIILPAPPEDAGYPPVDRDSLVANLQDQHIALPGFMIPLKFEQNIVSEFLLVPFLEQHVGRHLHHEANQMVYVYLEQGTPIQNPYAPYTVRGLMRLESIATEEGLTGYTLREARVEPYTY